MSHSTTATRPPKRRRKVFNRLVETSLWEKVSYHEYREGSWLRLRGTQRGRALGVQPDVAPRAAWAIECCGNANSISAAGKTFFDVGSGAGQIVRHLLKYADRDAEITGLDISSEMLRRARTRLKSNRPHFLSADLSRLPFADATFDCVTCGYVLEHLPDAKAGLAELSRVMSPGGRMLLMTTEDSFGGAWTSRLFLCRTYNRQELWNTCLEVGLEPVQELWLSDVHKVLRAGGICWDLRRV